MTETLVVLLRGINVGGKNKLPMQQLRTMVEELGGKQVQTYIQSGNLVCQTSPALGKQIAKKIEQKLFKNHDLKVPVVVVSAQQLQRVVDNNPYLAAGKPADTLHVGFLAAKPGAANLAKLDPERSPPDEYQVIDQQIFMCCPNGVARSKLTNAYFDKTLQTTSTMRNWKTVLKLLTMVKSK